MSEPVVYNRLNPFRAPVRRNINLNKPGSDKETRHLEISLAGSEISYLPGDSLAIFAENSDELINSTLEAAKLDPYELIVIDDQECRLVDLMRHNYDLRLLYKGLIKKYAEASGSDFLFSLLERENASELEKYIWGREVIDLLEEFPIKDLTAEAFISIIRKMPARLYSLSSSQRLYPDEVHATVVAVRYHAHNRPRKGACSTFLAENIKEGDVLPIFIQPNKKFYLPENPDQDIIMIGPGTGVAPFRAFLQERDAIDAKGRNWLFFGDQHYATDFLYQEEFEGYRDKGLLTYLDYAFSRDQKEKFYVQHRMQERGEELYQWLSEGAMIYVCGDKTHMAKDVQQMLIDIVAEYGSKSSEDATGYIMQMQKDKKYLKDVY